MSPLENAKKPRPAQATRKVRKMRRQKISVQDRRLSITAPSALLLNVDTNH